jgi:hypothetical protein
MPRRTLILLLLLLAPACELPPKDDGAAPDLPPATAAVQLPPPCPGAVPELTNEAIWECGPGGTWRLTTWQEWSCPDGERRSVTWMRRTRIPCEPDRRDQVVLDSP